MDNSASTVAVDKKPVQEVKPLKTQIRGQSEGVQKMVAPAFATDREYMAAVNAGDMATAQKMVNDKIASSGAKILPEIEVFEIRRGKTPDPKKSNQGVQEVFRGRTRQSESYVCRWG